MPRNVRFHKIGGPEVLRIEEVPTPQPQDDGRNDWMEKRNSEGKLTGWAENGEAARRSAIRIDARKWALARMAPKKYGEKLDLSHSGGLKVENEPDLSGLSNDELAVLKEIILKARRTAARLKPKR